MKHIFVALSITLLAISCCEDEQPRCGGSDPITVLPWLKDRILSIEDENDLSAKNNFIQQSVYRNRTIFLFDRCCASCNSVVSVFDCQGTSLGVLGNGQDDVTFSVLDNAFTIWQQDDFACAP